MKQQGYNHNISHLGLEFHVQTEDYGQPQCKVVTQLFWKGQLIDKREGPYTYNRGEDADAKLKETVHVLMKAQHKQMLMDLRDGRIDFPGNIKNAIAKTEAV